MADLASDSLSNLSLILRKTSPRLNTPGLLACCCGRVEVLVDIVGAFGSGEEERMLPRVCQLFEAIVWSTAEYLRFTAGRGAGASPPEFNTNGIGTPPHLVERPNYGNPGGSIYRGAEGGMRLSFVLGDFLVNAFVLRPFVRFLKALRCITKELTTFGRLFSPDCGDAVPNVSHRACEWVYVAMEKVGTWVVGGVSNIGGGIGGAAGEDAQPEMMEAFFRLMTEWIKELPGPSLQWLDAWMHVAVAGLAVRHRGPARAVLGFLQACCSQKDNHFKGAFSSLLTRSGLGVAVTRGLLSAMCSAIPTSMLDDVVTTLRSLFDCFMPATAVSWVDAVLQDPTFERFSASRESKALFSRELKENFCFQEWRAFKNCLKAFCRRKK